MRVKRAFTIDSAHRLPSHPGQCKYLHGHTYHFEVEFVSHDLLAKDPLVDFGLIKSLVGSVLNRWDHATLLHEQDELARVLKTHSQEVVTFKQEPTAEHMASTLFEMIEGALETIGGFSSVKLARVVCHETPGSSAAYP